MRNKLYVLLRVHCLSAIRFFIHSSFMTKLIKNLLVSLAI